MVETGSPGSARRCPGARPSQGCASAVVLLAADVLVLRGGRGVGRARGYRWRGGWWRQTVEPVAQDRIDVPVRAGARSMGAGAGPLQSLGPVALLEPDDS